MDTFEKRGFLSAEIEGYRIAMRKKFHRDFAACEVWSDKAVAQLNHLIPDGRPLETMFAAAYWIRCIRNCQGGILMAERGMVGESMTLVRAAAESLFHAAALLADPQTVDKLLSHDAAQKRKQALGMLKAADVGGNLDTK